MDTLVCHGGWILKLSILRSLFGNLHGFFASRKTEHNVGLLLPYQQCFCWRKKGCETANIQNRWWRLFQTTLFCSYDPALLDDPFCCIHIKIYRGVVFSSLFQDSSEHGALTKSDTQKASNDKPLSEYDVSKGSRFSKFWHFHAFSLGQQQQFAINLYLVTIWNVNLFVSNVYIHCLKLTYHSSERQQLGSMKFTFGALGLFSGTSC